MKRLAFAVGVIALGFAAAAPASAAAPAADNFSVVKFELGFCRIWWNAAGVPWGAGWTKVASAPTFDAAWAAQTAAVKKGACK